MRPVSPHWPGMSQPRSHASPFPSNAGPTECLRGFAAINGQVFTEVTSIGGSAITLAESGVGKVTSFAGSIYTIATSTAAPSSSSSGCVVFNRTDGTRPTKLNTYQKCGYGKCPPFPCLCPLIIGTCCNSRWSGTGGLGNVVEVYDSGAWIYL